MYCPECWKTRQNGDAAAPETPTTNPAPANKIRGRHDQEDTLPEGDVFPGIDLKAATRRAIGRMDIVEPTPIQEQSIPCLLAGRDLIGQARTGSGKTLAYAVPMVEKCDPSDRRVQALVLAPTRELAIQVAGVIETLASGQRLRVTLLYGGRSLRPEYTALRNGAQIIVGTPGRTLDHLRQGALDLSAVKFLVLDEADEMLDLGFARDVESILHRTPSKRQTALLSATMPDWVASTASKHLRDPITVAVDAGESTVPSVEHRVYSIKKADKMSALRTLLDRREGAPILVFGRTKRGVKQLANQLGAYGYPVGALQGNLSQSARERVMRDFRSGAVSILVATNVAARGLDVAGIGQVINYDLPDSEQLFTHRVGRTGRMGRAGEAVTFVTPDDGRKWREIERHLGHHFTLKSWNREAKSADLRR